MFMCYTCLSESTNIFGTNDVICHAIWCHLSFLTHHFSIFDDVGGVDSSDHVTCNWLPTRNVWSCMMSSNWRVWLQMVLSSCKNETMLFSSLGSLMRENGRSLFFPKRFWLKNKLSDRMCLADQCLADQLFLCSPLKHQDIFRLPSSIIIVNCLSLKD